MPKISKNEGVLTRVLVGLLFLLGAAALLFAAPWAKALAKTSYPQRYTGLVQRWAGEYGVDANLVYAVIRTESGFDAGAVSSAGAIGLMQITEDTFQWIAAQLPGQQEAQFEDLYHPEASIRFGAYFLSRCLAKYGGDVPTAAAAYHSGMGRVDALLKDARYTEDGVVLKTYPDRAMNYYVSKIGRSYQKYKALYTSEGNP